MATEAPRLKNLKVALLSSAKRRQLRCFVPDLVGDPSGSPE